MDLLNTYYALSTAVNYGIMYSFIPFLQLLIQYLRPDIVDVNNKVKIVAAEDIADIYDFIIVGAGSAGSVIANRLTENKKWKVLLLEAGGDGTVTDEVPGLFPYLQRNSISDWQFRTEPSPNYCLGMDNNQSRWPRGKLLGGSSAINYMVYVRGHKNDYDGWRDLGNPGWGYDDILPYFKKSEDIRIPELLNSSYHGRGGYLTVEHTRNDAPITKNFLAAAVELGYDMVDINGKTQTGFGYMQSTIRNGLRCDTAKAFLRSATRRGNLHVSTHSMVEKILINETTKTAYGVTFRRGGVEHTVHASMEVILSAGAVQSPQILMLSGIGPKEHLEEVGVKVILDSPGVGQNLIDHVGIGGLTYLYDDPTVAGSSNATSPGSAYVAELTKFLYKKTSAMDNWFGSQANGFISSGLHNSSMDYPDIQLIFLSGGENAGGGAVAQDIFGLSDDFADALYDNIARNTSYQIFPILLRPKSIGYIKLRDTNPNHHPIIVPNYFDDRRDMDILVKAAQIIYNISQTAAMTKLNARPNPNLTPGCGRFNASSYDYLECHIRHHTMTVYHPTCTCKMGPASDKMAVVDSRLRVHKMKGLRIIDASAMPATVSGNANAPTIMLAEKAADIIKEDYTVSKIWSSPIMLDALPKFLLAYCNVIPLSTRLNYGNIIPDWRPLRKMIPAGCKTVKMADVRLWSSTS